MPVQFADFSPKEREILEAIVDRAAVLFREQGQKLHRMHLEMDLSATHVTTPLRLNDLLAADNFNFLHDITGIMRHLDRTSGRLQDHFLPRFAHPSPLPVSES